MTNTNIEKFKKWRLSQKGTPVTGKTHKGLSQRQAAEMLGYSFRTVQAWEQGARNIPQQVMNTITDTQD